MFELQFSNHFVVLGAMHLVVDVRDPYALGVYGIEVVPFYGFENKATNKEYDGWDIKTYGESRDIEAKKWKAELVKGDRFVLIIKPRSPFSAHSKVNCAQHDKAEQHECIRKAYKTARREYDERPQEEKEVRILLEFPHVPVKMGEVNATKLSNEFFRDSKFAGHPKRDIQMQTVPTLNNSAVKDEKGQKLLEIHSIITWKVANLKSERDYGDAAKQQNKMDVGKIDLSALNLDEDDGP